MIGAETNIPSQTATKPRRGNSTFPALLILCVVAEIFFFCRYPDVYPTKIYYLSAVLEIIAAASLAVWAFQCHRRLQKRACALLLILSAVGVFFCLSDHYILLFRRETSGPGWASCLTHFLWCREYVASNELGFRERSLKEFLQQRAAVPGSRRRTLIAGLGDSFTWGQGVRYEERFSYIFEAYLRKAFGERFVFLNFGVGGGATRSETRVLEKSISQVAPQIVMIFYLSNDIEQKMVYCSPPYFERINTLGKLLRFSPTLNYLCWRTVAPISYRKFSTSYYGNVRAAYQDDSHFHRHLLDIKTLLDKSQALKARPIFVLLPFPHMRAETGWDGVDDIYKKSVRMFEAWAWT